MSYLLLDGRALTDVVHAVTVVDGGIPPAIAQRTTEATAFGPPTRSTRVQLAARSLTVVLDVRPATLALRASTVDTLARRLSGVRELALDDAPDRVWLAEAVAVRERTFPNAGSPIVELTAEFTLADPRRWERETQLLALSATPVPVPTGTGVSAPVVRLFGASTAVVDPKVVLRAPSGAELARLTLAGSLGSNTWLDIDSGTEWLHLVSSGTRTVALSWLVSGTFPLLDPADAAGASGPWPTLALESTSGTPTGVVLWRRSYV
jgi:hypothetical protein